MSCAIRFNLDQSKIFVSGNGLNKNQAVKDADNQIAKTQIENKFSK